MTFLRIVIPLYRLRLSMIFSENRYPLFRIMLQPCEPRSVAEPVPWWHRAGRTRRVGLLVFFDRCVPYQPQGHVSYAAHRPATHSTKRRPSRSSRPCRELFGICAEVFETADWIEQTSPASSVTEKTPVAHSEQRLHSILATLEQCRAGLIESASQETAQLLSVAILDLRMKLNRIADFELKALCDAMLRDDAPAERPQRSEISA